MKNEKPSQDNKHIFIHWFGFESSFFFFFFPRKGNEQSNQNRIRTEETTLSTSQKQERNTFAKEPLMFLPVGVPGFGKGR